MPAKTKTPQRNKAASSQRRAPVAAQRADVDVRAGEDAHVARPEPGVKLSRADPPRSRGTGAIERAIAKEDAKIIAKASARALRRGLH